MCWRRLVRRVEAIDALEASENQSSPGSRWRHLPFPRRNGDAAAKIKKVQGVCWRPALARKIGRKTTNLKGAAMDLEAIACDFWQETGYSQSFPRPIEQASLSSFQ